MTDVYHDRIQNYAHQLSKLVFPNLAIFENMTVIDLIRLSQVQDKMMLKKNNNKFSPIFNDTYGHCFKQIFKPEMVIKIAKKGKSCPEVLSNKCDHVCQMLEQVREALENETILKVSEAV